MKKLLLLLLLSAVTQAQTTMKQVDIDAASGNDYETLLTNVELGFGDFQLYLQRNQYSYDELYNYQNRNTLGKENVYDLSRYKKNSLTGVEKQSYVLVKSYFKKVPQYVLPMVTKVEVYGDRVAVIKLFCNFWSHSLNFNDVKVGEVVSTRFLTDVATLSFPDATTAKITVVTAKNR